MTKWFALPLFLAVVATTAAEDVKMATGAVLRNVTIKWESHPAFIYLEDTSKMYDGKKGVQKLYPVGTNQDNGRTYRAFTPSAEAAAERAESGK